MSRDLRIAILTIAVALPASWLLAQEPSFPGNLEQLQEVLKRLQAQVKSLQETVKQLSKEARRNKGAVAAPVSTSTVPPPQPPSSWQKAREAYKKAVRLEEQRQYRAAVEAYSEALDADPKSDAAFLRRGFCSYQLSDNEGAIADFSQSLVLQPNNSRAYLARATAYAASGNNASAMTDVSEAILRDPRNPDSYLLRARLYQQKGEHSLAMTDYTSASALAPNSEKSYLARATVFQADGQPRRALEDCEQAVRVNPNSSAGYLCRAEAYIKMNAPGRAVEEVNRALLTAQTLNQQLPLLTELAQAMPAAPGGGEKQVAKDQPVATPVEPIRPVSAAVTQTPQESTPAPAVAVVQPAPPAAIVPQRARAAVQFPSAPPAGSAPNAEDAKRFHLLGREQNSQQNFEPALNLLNRAIELDPWLASAYNARGYAYLRLTKFDRAVADFSEAIRLQPNYVNAYVNRSVARKHTGDSSGAVADQRKAAQLIAGDQPAAPKPPLSASR